MKQDTNRVPRDYEMVQAVLELELYILVRALRSMGGELCVLVCDDSFFILRYHRDVVGAFFESGGSAVPAKAAPAADVSEAPPARPPPSPSSRSR